MHTARIAFICEKAEKMFHIARKEDEGLRQHLLSNRLRIEPMEWNRPGVAWQDYDIILLKSPFDYHQKPEAFHHWLSTLRERDIPLLNPHHLVTWNMDKHYLKEIAGTGFPVIPSEFLEKTGAFPEKTGSPEGKTGGPREKTIDFDGLFRQFGTDRLIVKPCISGGSKNTFVVRKNDPAHREEITRLLESDAFIIQPFMEDIKDGECSLLFFNGQYSHSIVKKPREGDFRVQPQYGGSIHPHMPAENHIREAQQLLARFAGDAFYARVDGIIIDGLFTLMELELIEPILYLEYSEAGYSNYSDGLKARI